MTITYHHDLEQGTPEWLEQKRGILSAGSFKLLLTAKMALADNKGSRDHIHELLAQRISKYVEPTYVSDEMLRGLEIETDVKRIYTERYGVEVQDVGFVTNDEFGFTLGCSPDGLIGDDVTGGGLECKSRRQKYQIETIVDYVPGQIVPEDYVLQVQGGMLVTRRPWWEFVSYHGGLPMAVIRAYPDPVIQDVLIDAATKFEAKLQSKLGIWEAALVAAEANTTGLVTKPRLIPTERKIEEEMYS